LSDLPTEAAAQTRYLTTNYKGVGGKTAEALVKALGDRLFSVLQTQPEKLAEIVPANRAEQVLQGWRADYERRAARPKASPVVAPAAVAAPADDGAESAAESPAGDAAEKKTPARHRGRRGGGRRGGRGRSK
jgi:hypothetical protein